MRTHLIALLLIAAACQAPPTTSDVPSARSPSATAATATPAVSASVAPTPVPSTGPLSSRYGVVVPGHSPYMRSETDGAHLGDLPGDLDLAAVSPNGRMVAYWQFGAGGGARVLTVVDVAAPSRPRTLLDLPVSEVAATSTVIWSSDGQGLLVAVNSTDYVKQPVPDAPNLYAALREVDLTSGSVREIVRKEPGFPFYPIAWDRPRGIVAATQWGPGGFTAGYSVYRDGGPPQATGIPFTTLPRAIVASPDASRVLAFGFFAPDGHELHVSSLADPAQRTTLTAVGSARIVAAMWQSPREIVVSLTRSPDSNDADRLEVWALDGSRRVVIDAKHRLDAVRPDGTAAITSLGVVDLATGALAEIPGRPRVVASVALVRTSPSPTIGAQFYFDPGTAEFCGTFISYRPATAITSGDLRLSGTTFASSSGNPAPFQQVVNAAPGSWACVRGTIARSETTANLLTDFRIDTAPSRLVASMSNVTACGNIDDAFVTDLPSGGFITLDGTKFLVGGIRLAGQQVQLPPVGALYVGARACVTGGTLHQLDSSTYEAIGGRVEIR